MSKQTNAVNQQTTDRENYLQEIAKLKEEHEFNIIAKPWKTTLNARYFPKDHEENFLPSATIPDQSLTIKQILERHTRGIPTTSSYHPVYNGEEPFPDIHKLDISEVHELKLANRARIAEYQKGLRESQQVKPDEPSNQQPVSAPLS